MCGITGLICPKGASGHDLVRMNNLACHRGPDDEGYLYVWPDLQKILLQGGDDTPESVFDSSLPYAPASRDKRASEALVGLGHRRLSVVDTSSDGHQPMCTQNRQFWIVYNGEIYNYPELRAELKALGHTFVSGTDTEVILSAWKEWGKGCLGRFNGMFAFLLLDLNRKRFFAVRDRFGIKPLYYRVGRDGSIAFASEIKQFTVLPDWQAKMNGQRAYDFLVWNLLDHTDETLFKDVYQLRPGEFIDLSLEKLLADKSPLRPRLPVSRWYTLEATPFTGDFGKAGELFQSLLTDSVSIRRRADVPVGSCLSGGLDSSSIVVLLDQSLQKQGGGIQKTFSSCSNVERFDERRWIEIVADRTNIDDHYVYPSLNMLFETLPVITWHQDEPFGSTSIFAQWEVFKLAKANHMKVMLDGQGADEQLAGYIGFFGVRLASLFRSMKWRSLLHEIHAIKQVHGHSLTNSVMLLSNHILPNHIILLLQKILVQDIKSKPSWLNLKKLDAAPRNPLISQKNRPTSVHDLSYSQLTSTLLQMLLHWEDRNSMAHSIEARVPFLDYRLVEQVLGMPEDFKIANGVTKRVLRQGLKGILPEAIRTRMDKLGFVTPEEVWMREKQPELFKEKTMTAIEKSGGIINEQAMDNLIAIIDGKKGFNFLPWRIISFGAWIDTFSVTH